MRLRLALAVCLGLAFLAPAQAADAPPPAANTAAQQPWAGAIALRDLVWSDVQAQGILSVEDHVDAVEQALANAQVARVTDADGRTYALADGEADGDAMRTLLTLADPKTPVTILPDPYITLSMYLGSYYNEIEKPQDALRVLDLGLALDDKANSGQNIGETRPIVLGERGIALMGLKRWPECLESYEAGLRGEILEIPVRARLLRGRGLALTELGRLDEAEQSYRDSLKFEPGNKRALGELDYIAGLRAGKESTPVLLAPLTQPAAAPPKTPPAPPADPGLPADHT